MPLVVLSTAYVTCVPFVLYVGGLERFWRMPWRNTADPYLFIAFISITLVEVVSRPLRVVLERLPNAILVYVLTAFVAGAFASAKQALFWGTAFDHDYSIAEWDAVLHGGDAWHLVEPLMQPFLIRVVDRLYFAWIPLQLFVTFAVSWSAPGRVRSQYLISYFVLWVGLGTVAAGALGSGGPCYYGQLTGDVARFTPLLRAIGNPSNPLIATNLQAQLWAHAQANTWSPLPGISAMPSLHVAVACIIALLAWQSKRWVPRIAAILYLAVVQAGSVVLGWHYAVDGYVSIVATILIWLAVGRYLGTTESNEVHPQLLMAAPGSTPAAQIPENTL